MTKTPNLLSTELRNGVVGRKADNKRKIIRFLSRAEEPITIPEIALRILVQVMMMPMTSLYTAPLFYCKKGEGVILS